MYLNFNHAGHKKVSFEQVLQTSLMVLPFGCLAENLSKFSTHTNRYANFFESINCLFSDFNQILASNLPIN